MADADTKKKQTASLASLELRPATTFRAVKSPNAKRPSLELRAKPSAPEAPRLKPPQPTTDKGPELMPTPKSQPTVVVVLPGPPNEPYPVVDEPYPVLDTDLTPAPPPPAPALENPETPRPPPKKHAVSREILEQVLRENPHCRQIATPLVNPFFAEADALCPASLDGLPDAVTPESPRMDFVERPDEDRSPLHYGQMKLMLSELKLLTTYTTACSGGRYTVVYAGAAPGAHIPGLAALFPSCRFLLYDPAPFCRALAERPPSNVKVVKGFFTEQTAEELATALKGEAVVFISDIRTGKGEEYVAGDMERQEAWVRALNPVVAMVKFRLPWKPGKTPYLDGQVHLQAYPPLTSTETRLVVTQGDLGPDRTNRRVYDNADYERALAYHNTVGRVRLYAHEVAMRGLDHCFDCATLVATVDGYLRRAGRANTPGDIARLIKEMCHGFGTGRTLATAYTPSSNRAQKSFPRRRYEDDTFCEEKRAPRPLRSGARPEPRAQKTEITEHKGAQTQGQKEEI